jgi:hypothetical protein
MNDFSSEFFKVDNNYTIEQIIEARLPINCLKPTAFEPQFLHELFDDLYGNFIKEIQDVFWEQLKEVPEFRGHFWEKVLEKHMPFTKRHDDVREQGSDFLDLTEAKFGSGARYADDGTIVATIGNTKNKTGTLRICLCAWGQKYSPVAFMLVPYSEYSKWKSPMKVKFRNNNIPIGKRWDKYRCSFQDVIKPGV